MNKFSPAFNLSRLNHIFVFNQKKCFSQTSRIFKSFFESDSRGSDYPLVRDPDWRKLIKESGKAFVQESKLFCHEMKEALQQDRKFYEQGDTEVFFRFDSEECLKQWRISSDKVNKEGNSDCTFIINDKKKAVFSGVVDLALPKDGKKKFTGYCGIRSVRKKKSFFRDDAYLFEPFTHMELRVRGDGRSYAINLGIMMYFDVTWFTTYTFSIFTHGGPYWQVVRIPFSKFFLTSKGRIQDMQCPLPKHKINSIGITCAGVAGPFRLEIDYIGCHYDEREKEKFAYEMYDIPKEYVSS